MNNIKVYLVCIAKQENLYIKEFCDHYKHIGIDKIILYDNNELDGERFEGVINDYIESRFVDVKNYRGIHTPYKGKFLQDYVYFEAYKKYSNECDWFCFFDIDEFLILDKKYNNIKEFLFDNIFNDFDAIKLIWKNFDDNNLITYENKSLFERFTKICNNNDKQVKTIIRSNKDIGAINCHGKTLKEISFCNSEGKKSTYLNERHGNYINNFSYNNAYLNHYRLKTIDEFINTKMKRGDMAGEAAKQKCTFDFFFKYNEKTPEKLAYLKSLGIDYE